MSGLEGMMSLPVWYHVLSRGCLVPGMGLWQYPPVNRQTVVKRLPSPQLRWRTVIISSDIFRFESLNVIKMLIEVYSCL